MHTIYTDTFGRAWSEHRRYNREADRPHVSLAVPFTHDAHRAVRLPAPFNVRRA